MPTPGAEPLQNFAGSLRFPAQSRQRGANFSESPPLERNGMTASSMATRGNLRRQAVKSSAGVSD